jgi:hypothetical protein
LAIRAASIAAHAMRDARRADGTIDCDDSAYRTIKVWPEMAARLFTVQVAIGAIAAAITSSSRAAGAETSRAPLTLDWDAPAACPSKGEMLARIAQLVGANTAASEPLRARAAVTRDDAGGFRGSVDLSAASQTSTRRVDGASCAAVSDALALIVALSINPDAAPLPPAPEPARAAPSAPEPARAAPSPPPPSSESAASSAAVPPSREAHRPWALGASALIDPSTLGTTAFGIEAIAGWRPPPLALEIAADYLASERVTLAARPNEGAAFSLVHVGARGCYEARASRFGLGPCAGAGMDWIAGDGFGSQSPSNATGRMIVLSLSARAVAHIAPWIALRIALEGLAPLVRPQFEIDYAGTVVHVPSILVRASAGAELHF